MKAGAPWYVYSFQELIEELEMREKMKRLEVVGETTFSEVLLDAERRVSMKAVLSVS